MALPFFSTLFLFVLIALTEASPFPPGLAQRLQSRGINVGNSSTLSTFDTTVNGTGPHMMNHNFTGGLLPDDMASFHERWGGTNHCMDRKSHKGYNLIVGRTDVYFRKYLAGFCNGTNGQGVASHLGRNMVSLQLVSLKSLNWVEWENSGQGDEPRHIYVELNVYDPGPLKPQTVKALDGNECRKAINELINKCKYPAGRYPDVDQKDQDRIFGGWKDYGWGWLWFMVSKTEGPWCVGKDGKVCYN